MIIDEVQREPELILAIKSVVDRQKPALRGQFVLTGSANLLLMKRVGDSLAGRAFYLRLWPMTRREQLGLASAGIWERFFEEDVAGWLEIVRAEKTPQASWQTSSARGGFPEVAVDGNGLAAADRTLWFDGYITTYLERDLRDLAAVADLRDFQRVMQAAARRIGNLLNQSELGRDAKLPAMNARAAPGGYILAHSRRTRSRFCHRVEETAGRSRSEGGQAAGNAGHPGAALVSRRAPEAGARRNRSAWRGRELLAG
ncbi:MAG: AAA family ATPase [Gammaproteobacteria bacterium]